MRISEKRSWDAERSIGFRLLIWLSVAFAAAAPNPTKAQPLDDDCDRFYLRVALTNQTASELRLENGLDCFAIATGNEYQVLDWLENGEVDAAIVSPFAVALVNQNQASDGNGVFGFTTALPFRNRELPTYRFGISADFSGTPSNDLESAIDELITQLGDPSANGVIRLESYLHAGLHPLFDYVESRLDTGAESEAVFKRFVESIQFGEPIADAEAENLNFYITSQTVDERASSAPAFLELSGNENVSDVFVYKRSLASEIWGIEEEPEEFEPDAGEGTIGDWIRNPDSETDNDAIETLHEFMQKNYRVVDIGARQHRHFHYSLDELFTLLRDSSSGSSGEDRFGLILTGGGVKAAWQTRIVEALYGRWLTNPAPQPAGEIAENVADANGSILVDHVVGTSGGALLGIFVSALGNEAAQLTETLWRTDENSRYIESRDVFPLLEMPRYLSAVLSLVIFSIIGVLFFAAVKFSRKTWPTMENSVLLENVFAQNTTPKGFLVPEPQSGFTRPGTAWVALLVISPWIIKAGIENVLEHVPAITGLFFMIYSMIAIYSDNRVVFTKPFKWSAFDFKAVEVFWLFAGIAAILLPTYVRLSFVEPGTRVLREVFGREVELSTVAICVGIAIAFLVLHRAVSRKSDSILLVDRPLIAKAAFVLLLVVTIPQLALFTFGHPVHELTTEFWTFLLLYSTLVSILILVAGYFPYWQEVKNPIRAGLDFLRSPFPRNTYLFKFNRLTRVTLFFFMAFAYWNLVMAPALYGNQEATDYFVDMYVDFFCEEDERENCRNRLDEQRKWVPSTEFVMAATSLEEQRERYFVFDPNALAFDVDECPIDAQDDSRRLANLAALDRRWTVVECDVTDVQVIEVAFSSGSPFPVFPANEVDIIGSGERLVDGGYAHNMPIEAAVSLGATRALVVSSSPLHKHETSEITETIWTTGFLFHNIQRLFPYLFNRSQVEDLLSAQDSIVATIAPVLREEGWPILTDFRGETIEMLIEAASEDIGRRIGMVESWGSPGCIVDGNRFSCSDLVEFH